VGEWYRQKQLVESSIEEQINSKGMEKFFLSTEAQNVRQRSMSLSHKSSQPQFIDSLHLEQPQADLKV
jgi:hypothetical protein